MSNVLTAEADGPGIKLTMSFPDGYDHSFMVERFIGTVADDDGNPQDVWEPIHTGTAKFVQGETDYFLRYFLSPLGLPVHVPGPYIFRALAYRNAEPDSNVLILHTEGVYSDSVTV